MTGYVRPAVPHPVHTDRDGREFTYGSHWRFSGGPAEWAYSHDSHPERFAPLHAAADALVEHLTGTYDVVADPGPDLAALPWSWWPLPAHSRAARLLPASDDAAPLTVVWTDYPGLVVLVGLLTTDPYPTCGCDACDDDPEVLLDALEERVFAAAEGRFREWTTPRTRESGYEIVGPEGRRGGSWGPREELSRERFEEADRRLRALPDGRWQPWPRRAPGVGAPA